MQYIVLFSHRTVQLPVTKTHAIDVDNFVISVTTSIKNSLDTYVYFCMTFIINKSNQNSGLDEYNQLKT